MELHPQLASRLEVTEGQLLTLTTRRGRATAPARITSDIRPDTVFMPFHWAGPGRANSLTNAALDPVSRMPEFKVCAVRVERSQAVPEPVPQNVSDAVPGPAAEVAPRAGREHASPSSGAGWPRPGSPSGTGSWAGRAR